MSGRNKINHFFKKMMSEREDLADLIFREFKEPCSSCNTTQCWVAWRQFPRHRMRYYSCGGIIVHTNDVAITSSSRWQSITKHDLQVLSDQLMDRGDSRGNRLAVLLTKPILQTLSHEENPFIDPSPLGWDIPYWVLWRIGRLKYRNSLLGIPITWKVSCWDIVDRFFGEWYIQQDPRIFQKNTEYRRFGNGFLPVSTTDEEIASSIRKEITETFGLSVSGKDGIITITG